ncbi:MAG: OmpA family protein [Prevotellaceae bacterium]|jgi:outer membrane protein OmpA-like peptidoglycan-associated protein|nr:OmpA family protein [Prevotellaceae bacterium]
MKKINTMKQVFLWMICGLLSIQNNVSAQQTEYSHWSLDLKLGANKAEYAGGILTKQGLGFTFGAELERTFNPLWGLALGYTYLGYSHANVDGKAHEITGLASINLANLVERYRQGNWQRLNVYGRLGAGFSLYSAKNNGATVVIPMGASIEYNVTPRLAISLNGDRRWHLSSNMGFASAVQDGAVFWAATAGLRFKFGKKSRPHVRNTSLTNYEAPYVTAVYDDTPLQERIDRNEAAVNQLQDQLNKANDDLNKTNAELNKANEKIAACCAGATRSSINPYITPAFRFENIEYEADKYEIPLSSRSRVDGLAETLKEYPDVKIEIVGHTDVLGQETFNKSLSLKRADAVKDYLVGKGVEATRITTKGVADAQPIAPNTTFEGRQKNRRIEIIFLTSK